jgi:hypothetical protein
MRIEIALDDAILQHAGEHDAVAAAKLAASSMTADSTTATTARIAASGATIRRSMNDTASATTARPTRTTNVALWVAPAKATKRTKARRSLRLSVSGRVTMRCRASTARPAKMSVSRMPAIHGSVVVTERPTTIANKVHGRSPNPCDRSTSASTQTVTAACSATTGQKSSGQPAATSNP